MTLRCSMTKSTGGAYRRAAAARGRRPGRGPPIRPPAQYRSTGGGSGASTPLAPSVASNASAHEPSS